MQARIKQEHAIAAVHALDLEPIRLRLMDPRRGEGWTRERADEVEHAYRAYLTMLVKHPEAIENIVVSEDVDEFWHAHILHTMKYSSDCQKVFGAYLHHKPEVEARSSADIERTRLLYQREFHADLRGSAMCSAAVQAGDATMCSAAIRPAMCSAAVQASDSAMCSAAIQKAAMCSAAIQPAMCSAAVRAGDVAMCSAAVRAGAVTRETAAVAA